MNITQRNATTPDGINLEGADYVTIEGFTVNNMPRTGIRAVLNHHVIIRNNHCDNNFKWGILTGFSDDILIEGNVTSRSQDRARHLLSATAPTGRSSATTSRGATAPTAST